MVGEIDAELQRYANLVVTLAQPSADRDAILAKQGFDEESWETYDADWQNRLSESERVADANGQIPELWLAFSQALQRAQEQAQQQANTSLPDLETYAAIARVLARGGNVAGALEQHGLSIFAFLETHRHYITRATSDDALAKKLAKLLS